jgi:hypothetical protein
MGKNGIIFAKAKRVCCWRGMRPEVLYSFAEVKGGKR